MAFGPPSIHLRSPGSCARLLQGTNESVHFCLRVKVTDDTDGFHLFFRCRTHPPPQVSAFPGVLWEGGFKLFPQHAQMLGNPVNVNEKGHPSVIARGRPNLQDRSLATLGELSHIPDMVRGTTRTQNTGNAVPHFGEERADAMLVSQRLLLLQPIRTGLSGRPARFGLRNLWFHQVDLRE